MAALSAEQQAIDDQIEDFLTAKTVSKPYFTFQGLAGTGKSHLLAHVARRHPGATLCSLTGKAASVLSRRTGMPASTIHSAIYEFLGEDKDTRELQFGRAIDNGDWSGQVALVDEVSMIPHDIAGDLLATGCRVIACGDPGQLPPVKGEMFFSEADAMLTTVHRQAWDSPIIRQAHAVRAGRRYEADGSAFRVAPFCSAEDVLEADILLCWTNATRMALNSLKRAHLGLANFEPRRGEPVMCLRNDRRLGIMNGAIYTLLEDYTIGSGRIWVQNERNEETEVGNVWIEGLESPRQDEGLGNQAHPFCYGYAATVHKFQGSEADSVLLVDEYRQENWVPWAYTGITRAKHKILVKV